MYNILKLFEILHKSDIIIIIIIDINVYYLYIILYIHTYFI